MSYIAVIIFLLTLTLLFGSLRDLILDGRRFLLELFLPSSSK